MYVQTYEFRVLLDYTLPTHTPNLGELFLWHALQSVYLQAPRSSRCFSQRGKLPHRVYNFQDTVYEYGGVCLNSNMFQNVTHLCSKCCYLETAGSSLIHWKGKNTRVNDAHSANPVPRKEQIENISQRTNRELCCDINEDFENT